MTEFAGERPNRPPVAPQKTDSRASADTTVPKPRTGGLREWFSRFVKKPENLVGTAGLAGAVVATGITAEQELGVPISPTIENTASHAAINLKDSGQDAYDSIRGHFNSTSEDERQLQHLQNVLNRIEQPRDGERLIDAPFKVVAAGNDFTERQDMIDNKMPVKVRNKAGTHTDSGQFSRVLDEVPQGAESERVVIVPGKAPLSEEDADWVYGAWKYLENPTDPNSPTITVEGEIYNIFTEQVGPERIPTLVDQ